MTIEGVYTGFALAGNPLVAADARAGKVGTLTVRYDEAPAYGNVVFKGRFTPPLRLDLSQVAASVAMDFPEPPESIDGAIATVEGEDAFSDRVLTVDSEVDGVTESASVRLVPGRVPLAVCRLLRRAGTDIMQERFLRHDGNFFLTVRRAAGHRRLVVPETSLAPLYFLLDKAAEVRVWDTVFGYRLPSANLATGVHVFDPAAARRYVYGHFSAIASTFRVEVAGQGWCDVVVGRADPSLHRCRLRFRNSLGVPEVLAVSGLPSESLDFGEDDGRYGTYDSLTDTFMLARGSRVPERSLTVATGVLPPSEAEVLEDLLCSREVWLLDVAPVPVRVIAECGELERDMPPEAPRSYTLRLTLCEDAVPAADDIPAGDSQGVFSREFSDEFN